jgi:proteasome accessory factor C
MLVIVPYLVQHPGSSMREVAALFDVPPDQLRRDLDLLFLAGLPPYGPGALVDVHVDEEDRIWVSMADHFSRPLRLTRMEALAIAVRAQELLATPGVPQAPALESALAKLRDSLEVPLARGIERAAARTGAPIHLDAVRAAARDRRRVRITYVAASTAERTERTIEPEEVFSSMGQWYVAAWDTGAGAERLFRVDRIGELTETGERFEPRGLAGAGRALYSSTDDDVAVRLRLAPAARWVAEYYVCTEVRELDDGSVEVTLPARRLGWVARLLLRLGPDATVLNPPELADQVRELARRAIGRYR